jgi:CheY-like chemotaxis protein
MRKHAADSLREVKMNKYKVLICEDDLDSLKAMQETLSRRGYQVTGVPDGQKAIETARTSKPDLILMDIRMPKLDGIDAVKQIRKVNKTSRIIFVTAFQSPQMQKECSKYDISGYIIKPASPQIIIDMIEKALAK